MDSSKYGIIECLVYDVKAHWIEHVFAFPCHVVDACHLRGVYFGEYQRWGLCCREGLVSLDKGTRESFFWFWFDQVNVNDPELEVACSHDVCLQICEVDVKADFVSELSVKLLFLGVSYY